MNIVAQDAETKRLLENLERAYYSYLLPPSDSCIDPMTQACARLAEHAERQAPHSVSEADAMDAEGA